MGGMHGRRGQCGEGQATASKTEPFFVAERAARARVPLNLYRRFEPLQTLRRGQPCSVDATVLCLPCCRAHSVQLDMVTPGSADRVCSGRGRR